MVKETNEYVVIIDLAPDDWNCSEGQDTGLRYVRTHLRYGMRGAKPDNYIMDDLNFLWESPRERKYWTFDLFRSTERHLFYKRHIHTWS